MATSYRKRGPGATSLPPPRASCRPADSRMASNGCIRRGFLLPTLPLSPPFHPTLPPTPSPLRTRPSATDSITSGGPAEWIPHEGRDAQRPDDNPGSFASSIPAVGRPQGYPQPSPRRKRIWSTLPRKPRPRRPSRLTAPNPPRRGRKPRGNSMIPFVARRRSFEQKQRRELAAAEPLIARERLRQWRRAKPAHRIRRPSLIKGGR